MKPSERCAKRLHGLGVSSVELLEDMLANVIAEQTGCDKMLELCETAIEQNDLNFIQDILNNEAGLEKAPR